jgi:predicted metal-dependent HD superfamily phosphohydrolase
MMNPELRECLAVWYGTPGRHYHTLEHVDEVLGHLAHCRTLLRQPDEVRVAVLFHDAVYEVGRPDNEAKSAVLAREHAPRWFDVDVDRVAQLIELTASHGKQGEVDADAALFLDCDMAILGSGPERYALYADQIEAEWSPLAPPADYARGRAAFLEKVLAGRIFLSSFWHDRLDEVARRNLRQELARYRDQA